MMFIISIDDDVYYIYRWWCLSYLWMMMFIFSIDDDVYFIDRWWCLLYLSLFFCDCWHFTIISISFAMIWSSTHSPRHSPFFFLIFSYFSFVFISSLLTWFVIPFYFIIFSLFHLPSILCLPLFFFISLYLYFFIYSFLFFNFHFFLLLFISSSPHLLITQFYLMMPIGILIAVVVSINLLYQSL